MRTARLLTVSQHALKGEGVPTQGYLPRDSVSAQGQCTCPGGWDVPAWGRECTCHWGVPARGIPAHGGVPAQGVPARGYLPRYSSPSVNRMTDRCKNITCLKFRLRAVTIKKTQPNSISLLPQFEISPISQV